MVYPAYCSCTYSIYIIYINWMTKLSGYQQFGPYQDSALCLRVDYWYSFSFQCLAVFVAISFISAIALYNNLWFLTSLVWNYENLNKMSLLYGYYYSEKWCLIECVSEKWCPHWMCEWKVMPSLNDWGKSDALIECVSEKWCPHWMFEWKVMPSLKVSVEWMPSSLYVQGRGTPLYCSDTMCIVFKKCSNFNNIFM